MSGGLEIRVGGRWLSSVGMWGGLSYKTASTGGPDEAEWEMQLPASTHHPFLRRGAIVEVLLGSYPVWKGVLAEPTYGDNGWEFHAHGLAAEGKRYLCLNSLGLPNGAIDGVIDQAIGRGLPWLRPVSINPWEFGNLGTENPSRYNYISDLMSAYADMVGKRWGVGADGIVYLKVDDATPSWHMTPGSGVFGLADDEYASHVYIQYISEAFLPVTQSFNDPVAAANFGRSERMVDATSMGPTAWLNVAALGAGLLAKGAPRLGWTAPLDVTRWQLTTPGGTPASLPAVKAQQMVRLHGVTNTQGVPLPYVDFVIGATTYNDDDGTLTIAPVELAARSLADVLAVAPPEDVML